MHYDDMSNFIKTKIKEDLASGRVNKVVVRFPPEPNGYLHLGHVKSIVLNSTLAREFNGEMNLRFDDTNPEKENIEYVNAIKNDTLWLADNISKIVWASDYFDTLFECAVHLINKGLAYVDDSSIENIKKHRGDFNTLGINSPNRTRSIEENLNEFNKMKSGIYADGEKVLRAKIDMSHTNLNMRDPILYRIRHATHHNTKDKWCIYPMYDWAHPLSDAIEGVTHSICTLEFADHRPLYDWCIDNCFDMLHVKPEQIEFARLEMEGVLLSKRKLNLLVESKEVASWDSPVMPTISGMRRRGFTAEILKSFILKSGFSKSHSIIEKAVLEDTIRDVLNPYAMRKMAIINPVSLEIINWEEDKYEVLSMPNHPKDKTLGERELHLGKHLWVEVDDVRANCDDNFWRIYPGNWVRLKHGYNILIKEVIMNNNVPVKVLAEIDMDSKNMKMAKHKAKVALHWLSSIDSVHTNCFFYSNLCDADGAYSPESMIKRSILVEKSVLDVMDRHYEFERNGYFYVSADGVSCLTYLKDNKK